MKQSSHDRGCHSFPLPATEQYEVIIIRFHDNNEITCTKAFKLVMDGIAGASSDPTMAAVEVRGNIPLLWIP